MTKRVEKSKTSKAVEAKKVEKRKIKYIVIHCTGGPTNQSVEVIKNYWKNVLNWNSVGYHRLIEANGKIHKLADFGSVTNGVKGFNSVSIHISYIGGAGGKDTRTEEQKASLLECIKEALEWIGEKVIIQGHRDFSDDKNRNGIIDPWERIKECPSFDAKTEYEWIIK